MTQSPFALSESSSKMRVIFIVGATATGKSAFALECAKRFGGEIINGDSIQMYKSVDIGSAKPTVEEQRSVPHHLIDFIGEGESYTAGQFRRDALAVLQDANKRNVPLMYIVGGSGFYIQALEKGLFEIPDVEAKIKEDVRNESIERLYQELKAKDPKYAEKVKPQDSYRIRRAVEVIRGTTKTFTHFRESFKSEKFPYPIFKIGLRLPKVQLVEQIKRRVVTMLGNGLIEETRGLLEKNLEEWPALKSVGYKECVQHLKNEIDATELENAIVHSTTQLAKRQSTWFKRDMDIHWFDPKTELDAAFRQVEQCIQ